jgi:hypothetical protein
VIPRKLINLILRSFKRKVLVPKRVHGWFARFEQAIRRFGYQIFIFHGSSFDFLRIGIQSPLLPLTELKLRLLHRVSR